MLTRKFFFYNFTNVVDISYSLDGNRPTFFLSLTKIKNVKRVLSLSSLLLSRDNYNVFVIFFQEGITGTWFPAWVLLQQRTLIYTKSFEPAFAINFEYVDLRKARCIGKLRLKAL